MDWYRQEFDIPQTASTQQTLHLLASEQLIIAQDAGNYAITNLDALLFARDFNDFPTVARKALRVIRYDGPSPISPSRSKTFSQGMPSWIKRWNVSKHCCLSRKSFKVYDVSP